MADKPQASGEIAADIQALKGHKAEIEAKQAEADKWQAVANIPKQRAEAEQQRLKAEEEAERQRLQAEQERQRAEQERLMAERKAEQEAKRKAEEEARQREIEEANGIPDWTDDTPEKARRRGKKRVNGQLFYRQAPLQGVQGKQVSVKFGNNDVATAHISSDRSQPTATEPQAG